MDSSTDTQNGTKRKRTFRQDANKRAKPDDSGAAALKSGFGAKMLAKMGYKGTGGLGREGHGIENPIEVVMRGTKGGVGAVKEKSAQQIAEERRRAEINGEKYEEDSEEERKERKKKAKAARVTDTAAPRPKKTIYDLEAEGVQVPPTLHAILDATTGESTSTSAVRLRGGDIPFENSVQARLKRDIAAFGEAFDQLKTESEAIPPQEYALEEETKALESQIREAQDVASTLESVRTSTDLRDVCEAFKILQKTYPSRTFHREAIAVIHPLFTKIVAAWSPLDDPLENVVDSFSSLTSVIEPQAKKTAHASVYLPTGALVSYADDIEPQKRSSSSAYESMMLKIWLPVVSSAVTQWDVTDPYPLIHLMELWNPILPGFITKRLVHQITRKLTTSVEQWNPRKSKKNPTWIVEWLPYLSHDDLDPKGHGLLAEVKRKLRVAFQTTDISRGPMRGLEQWKTTLGSEFDHQLVTHLVPRLCTHLKTNFEVNPADQDLSPLNEVLKWSPFLKPEIMGEILSAPSCFFSKFLAILHTWLVSPDASFEEIGAWFSWWKNDVIGGLSNVPIVAENFDKALKLINTAIDLGERAEAELPLPEAEEPARASPETPQFSKSINAEPPRSARKEIEETTFRDVVEEWAGEENLLFMPIRAAHETTGEPLYRITASASGKGGAVVYLKGDVVWAQNRKDKSLWEPIGLDEKLVSRAEGK